MLKLATNLFIHINKYKKKPPTSLNINKTLIGTAGSYYKNITTYVYNR